MAKQRKNNIVRLTESQLRRLILRELYAGSNVGSYLKQGVKLLWESDNMIQRALSEAETSQEQKLIGEIHKLIEKVAYDVDTKMQGILSGDVNKQVQKQRKLPQAPKKGA